MALGGGFETRFPVDAGIMMLFVVTGIYGVFGSAGLVVVPQSAWPRRIFSWRASLGVAGIGILNFIAIGKLTFGGADVEVGVGAFVTICAGAPATFLGSLAEQEQRTRLG